MPVLLFGWCSENGSDQAHLPGKLWVLINWIPIQVVNFWILKIFWPTKIDLTQKPHFFGSGFWHIFIWAIVYQLKMSNLIFQSQKQLYNCKCLPLSVPPPSWQSAIMAISHCANQSQSVKISQFVYYINTKYLYFQFVTDIVYACSYLFSFNIFLTSTLGNLLFSCLDRHS